MSIQVPNIKNKILRVQALAVLTFKEGIRERAIYGIGLAALIFSSISIPVTGFFMRDLDKISVDFNLAAVSFASLLLLFFVSINLMAKDMERKTLFFVLSKPFSRGEYILGKLFGLIFLSTAAVAVLCLAAWASVFITRAIYPNHFTGFAWPSFFIAVYGHTLMLVLLNAVVVFFSTLTTSSFLTLLFSVSTYIAGQTVEEVYLFLQQQSETVPLSGFVKTTIDILHYAAPNLSVFDLKAMAAHSLPVSGAYILSITLYALVYSGILAGAATFIFSRRNFS